MCLFSNCSQSAHSWERKKKKEKNTQYNEVVLERLPHYLIRRLIKYIKIRAGFQLRYWPVREFD